MLRKKRKVKAGQKRKETSDTIQKNIVVKVDKCFLNGIKRYGESCTLNNNCTYPKCLEK